MCTFNISYSLLMMNSFNISITVKILFFTFVFEKYFFWVKNALKILLSYLLACLISSKKSALILVCEVFFFFLAGGCLAVSLSVVVKYLTWCAMVWFFSMFLVFHSVCWICGFVVCIKFGKYSAILFIKSFLVLTLDSSSSSRTPVTHVLAHLKIVQKFCDELCVLVFTLLPLGLLFWLFSFLCLQVQ